MTECNRWTCRLSGDSTPDIIRGKNEPSKTEEGMSAEQFRRRVLFPKPHWTDADVENYAALKVREAIEPLKAHCDRDWHNESPEVIVTIVANSLSWRGLGKERDALVRKCAEIARKEISYDMLGQMAADAILRAFEVPGE